MSETHDVRAGPEAPPESKAPPRPLEPQPEPPGKPGGPIALPDTALAGAEPAAEEPERIGGAIPLGQAPSEVPPVVPPSVSGPPGPARPLLPTWALLLFLAGLLIIAAVGYGVLRQWWSGTSAESGVQPVAVGKLATFDSPPSLPDDLPILQENGLALPAVLPVTLELERTLYPIVPVTLENGRWPVPAHEQQVAVWVYGTVVNYVVGLPHSAAAEAQLGSLTSGDRITLTLSNGTTLLFGAPQAERYPVDAGEPLAQRQPGLTLVLFGGGESNRLVVKARYLPEESPLTGGAQQVGDLELTVLDSGLLETESVQAERRLVVEYRVVNRGATEIDPALFDMVLVDGDGARYALNPEVAAQGEYGPLRLSIPPESSVEGSAGYLVPRDLKPPLTWVFRPDATTAQAARFSLPYAPPLAGPPQPEVSLTEAIADRERDVIILGGIIRNRGESALPVTLDNVNLTSSAGAAQLRTSTPVLPWTVGPGGEQRFELQFSWPAGVSSVLLDLYGFTFEIEGLP